MWIVALDASVLRSLVDLLVLAGKLGRGFGGLDVFASGAVAAFAAGAL